tara:strand:+ start:5695 stop:5871 length:177 start_codon:yes stop_codon:yes gene_type:complete
MKKINPTSKNKTLKSIIEEKLRIRENGITKRLLEKYKPSIDIKKNYDVYKKIKEEKVA